MKRSAALAPLSRHHQHALDAALRLRRADDDTVTEAIARFERFFDEEGRRQFAIEEQLLLPAIPIDEAEWAPCVARIRDDHAAVRAAGQRARRPAADARPPVACASARRAARGARSLRERVAFAILERRLAAPDLERLGRAIAQAEGQGGQ
jgi:hypothetical protein